MGGLTKRHTDPLSLRYCPSMLIARGVKEIVEGQGPIGDTISVRLLGYGLTRGLATSLR